MMDNNIVKHVSCIGISAALLLGLAGLTGCGGSGSQGVQDDSRYSNDNTELVAPNTTEATDGTVLNAPENYVPAFKHNQEGNEVIEEEFDKEFEVNGVKYTFHAPSKVHASKTYEGRDSFFLDIDIKSDDPYELNNIHNIFFYMPNGLYSNDLIEQAKDEENMKKIQELEAQNKEVPEELYTGAENYENSASKELTRRTEIAYDGDGDYTAEVRDFVNNKLYRITFPVTLS